MPFNKPSLSFLFLVFISFGTYFLLYFYKDINISYFEITFILVSYIFSFFSYFYSLFFIKKNNRLEYEFSIFSYIPILNYLIIIMFLFYFFIYPFKYFNNKGLISDK